MLLADAGLLSRAQIYATDLSDKALETARRGRYPLSDGVRYSENYLQTEPPGPLARYFTSTNRHLTFDPRLGERIVFSRHNLVSDTVFGEMQMILCRNVLIYFDVPLRNRVLQLFSDSLCHRGYLGLGSQGSLVGTDAHQRFETKDAPNRLYRKRSGTSRPDPIPG